MYGTLNGLSLFSGIGGLDVGLSEYVKPIAYCEIEPFCESVLLSRMQEGDLPKAPIWDDIRTLCGNQLPKVIDIIYAGFPCQDISIAGLGKGLEGERSGLFFEIMRLAKEIKPRFIFLENVPAITTRGGLQVVREITNLGYDCRWCIISAKSVGAMHLRKRWFLLANSKSKKCTGLPVRKKKRQSTTRICCKYKTVNEWKKAVSEMDKLADGVPNQLDRIKALGNAVVPIQAKKAFKLLLGDIS